MKNKKHIRVGEKHKMFNGNILEIIEYYDSRNSTIKFQDGTILKNIIYSHINNGYVKNPNNKNIYNIGYIGQGKYNYIKFNKFYVIWNSMLTRCYSEKQQLKTPTYIGCTVVEEWYNFQVFAEWCENNYIDDFVLDKDILIKGNKIYGPDTCCFVPIEINNLFVKNNINRGDLPIGIYLNRNNYGVKLSIFGIKNYLGTYNTISEAFNIYKEAKENQIKKVAEIWKNKIPEKTYLVLINYKVEITD